MTAYTVTNIGTDALYIVAGILRTARTAHTLHHLKVGNVVAYEHHLLVLQSVALQQLFISRNLHSGTHTDVLHAKSFIAFAHSRRVATRNDTDTQPHLAGQLYGIAVLDIYRAQRLALRTKEYCFSREHPVDIKQNRLYLLQIVVYHDYLEYKSYLPDSTFLLLCCLAIISDILMYSFCRLSLSASIAACESIMFWSPRTAGPV